MTKIMEQIKSFDLYTQLEIAQNIWDSVSVPQEDFRNEDVLEIEDRYSKYKKDNTRGVPDAVFLKEIKTKFSY